MKLNRQNIPFTMVANEVLSRTDISWKAKGLYAYLFSKPSDWDFAAERIALEGQGDRKTILVTLQELESAGLLKRSRLSNGRVEYEVLYADSHSPKSGLRLFDPQSENATVAKRHGDKNGLISNKDLNTKKEEESNTDFVRFWEMYPRSENKKKALASWNRLSVKDREAVFADIPKRKMTDQWQKGFIPHPTTYLNGERWNDELKITSTNFTGVHVI